VLQAVPIIAFNGDRDRRSKDTGTNGWSTGRYHCSSKFDECYTQSKQVVVRF
jgi:hypothetical protein